MAHILNTSGKDKAKRNELRSSSLDLEEDLECPCGKNTCAGKSYEASHVIELAEGKYCLILTKCNSTLMEKCQKPFELVREAQANILCPTDHTRSVCQQCDVGQEFRYYESRHTVTGAAESPIHRNATVMLKKQEKTIEALQAENKFLHQQVTSLQTQLEHLHLEEKSEGDVSEGKEETELDEEQGTPFSKKK